MKNKTMIIMTSTMLVVLLAMGIYGVNKGSQALEISNTSTTATSVKLAGDGGQYLVDDSFKTEDLDASWDTATANRITLSGNSASLEGDGMRFVDNVITIVQAGTYVVSGTSENIQLVVDADKDKDLVRIVLNNVAMSHSTSAPINVKAADKALVILADQSVNTLSDASTYQYAQGEDEPNAALFSKEDLTINGRGTLNVKGNYKNGIVSKDDLKIVSGTLNITAQNDAIKGKDSVAIQDGNFTLVSGGDGIQASNDVDGSKGWVSIRDGVYTIKAQGDGVQAASMLQVIDGDFNIKTGQKAADVSRKGLKATGDVAVYGGRLMLDAGDDAVHSNANVTIHGGALTITTGDDGLHADDTLTIQDGDINILESYEGLEGASVIVNGGKVTLKASDDGINAAGGSDAPKTMADQFKQGGSNVLEINGGSVVVDAGGDGLDSNGDLKITGGDVVVNGPTSDGDGALDFDGQSTITGGSLMAAGSSGMLQLPNQNGTQGVLAVVFNTKQSANTAVSVKNAAGETVMQFNASKQFQSVVFSSSDLKVGESYKVFSNNTQLLEVTLDTAVKAVTETGASYVVKGMGGPQGGQRPGGQPGMQVDMSDKPAGRMPTQP